MSFVESILNTNEHNIVRDAKDFYIEVDNEEIADQIELVERQQVELDIEKNVLTALIAIQ